jgi:hypothetical protein
MLTSRGSLRWAFIGCLWALFATTSTSASTPIYTFTDDSGTQNFTTEFGSIPDKYRHRAIRLHLDSSSSTPSVSTPPSPPRPAPAPPAATEHRVPGPNARVVQGGGEYPMGDYDTRAEAMRMAVEAAKREALEKVATYLESVTEVKNMEVTRDEIRTYTAGVVTVLDQQITTRLDGDTVVLRADLTVQVDPDEVMKAIAALRENESAKTELAALRTEADQLQQQLAAASQALSTAVSPEQVQELNQQRQDLLNQLQANAYVSQAWTTWGYVTPVIYPYPWLRLQHVNGLLLHAQHLYPRNPHLSRAREFVGKHPGAPAAQPGTPSPTPPPSLLVPPPASMRMNPLATTVYPGSANAQANSHIAQPPPGAPQTLVPGSATRPTTRVPAPAMAQSFLNPVPSGQPQIATPHVQHHDHLSRHHSPSGTSGHHGASGGHESAGSHSGHTR